MKHFILMMMTAFAFANAQAADITVTPCPKNSAALRVDISGDSAMQMYSFTAKRLGISTSELGQCITNNMNCRPTALSPSGEPTAVTCSYLMNGKVNVAYPQIDPGYGGEQPLVCD